MLTLNDGRSELWQWDTGRKLTVDADCSQVHFSNKIFGRSIDVDVVDGVAIIPDVLLQTDKDLNVWAFVGTAENGYTKISKTFKVNRRNKPADYVFTPPDQTSLEEIKEKIKHLESIQDPDAIKNAVDDYLQNNPIQIDEKDPTVPDWAKQHTKPKYTADEVGAVATVNGTAPDENGNVEIEIPEASEPDMTGYATERYVQENYQPKGNYLTEIPEDYAKTEDIPTKPEDIGAQPAGNYLTEVPSGYATEEFVKNKIAEAELGGEEVDLSGYAQKSELPTKVSELENDAGYLTEHQDLSDYAKKTELPVVPVQSVNGKTGSVKLSASDVGARPNTWMPTARDVGALPSTYTPPNQTAEQVGADPKGTAETAVSQHDTDTEAHNDIRLELKVINDRLTAFFDSDDQALDELSEIVAYITSNKSLIDSITTSKVSVADIVNNLTTNVSNKPLSATQGVVLKGLIDTVSNKLANYQPKGDYALKSQIPTVPTKVSAFDNDAGYLTKHQDISGKANVSDVFEYTENPAFTNLFDTVEIEYGKMINMTDKTVEDNTATLATTGYIPVKAGDVIRVNEDFPLYNTGSTAYILYDADKNALQSFRLSAIVDGNYYVSLLESDSNGYVTACQINKPASVAFIRICNNTTVIGENPVLTVNEEIRYEMGYGERLNPRVKVDFSQVINSPQKNCWNILPYERLNIAHSSIGRKPINTIAHFTDAAVNYGYNVLKCDVRPTSDGELVCCHDAGFTFDGNGYITTYDSANATAIRNVTAETCLGYSFKTGEHPCLVGDYLDICRKYGKVAFVTIRNEYMDVVIPKLLEELRIHNMTYSSIINCMTYESLVQWRQQDTNVMINYTLNAGVAIDKALIDRAIGLGYCSLCGFGLTSSATTPNNSCDFEYASANGIRLLQAIAYKEGSPEACYEMGYDGCQIGYAWNPVSQGLDEESVNEMIANAIGTAIGGAY